MRKYSFLLGLSIILLFYIAHANSQINYVNITIYNPYRLSAKLEVKCDYNSERKQFNFHKFIYVAGKKATRISVPNDQKECQIWPKIKVFGKIR